MHHWVNWWSAVSAISAAFTAAFVVATFCVYRQIREVMKKANAIAERNFRDQYAPLVWLGPPAKTTGSGTTTATWHLRNIGHDLPKRGFLVKRA